MNVEILLAELGFGMFLGVFKKGYMKKFAIIVLSCVAASAAHATTVVTFDSLSGQSVLSGNYAGINWAGNWDYYDYSQYPYTAESGSERVYVDYNNEDPTFYFATPTQFDGAYFAGYDDVSFSMYNGASLVATSGTLGLSGTPQYLASGYSGSVTSVVVNGDNDYYVMDNVTYGASSTPSPAAALPMVGGLIGLARKRRKQA
jgi:hypothetical protein